LAQDAEGLWIGTDTGLFLHAGGRFRSFSGRNGLPASAVRAIFRDGKGVLWVGTDGAGVARLADGAFVSYSAAEGLAGDNVRFIHEDRRGALWIGTYGGLSRF